MRDILFRGKQKGIMNWVEGTGIFTDGINTWLSANEPNRPIAYGLKHKIVLPETIGQFTGLTDKNGKKVFENDIIVICYETDGEEFTETKRVHYNEKECCWYPMRWEECCEYCDHYTEVKSIEIIGNIHDNPELLENP